MPRRTRLVCLVAAYLALPLHAARAEPPPNVAPPAPPPLPAEPSECAVRLKELAAFARLPAIIGPGECGGDDLVKLDGVLMPDRSRVALNPPATLRCGMAEAVAQFVRSEVAPAAAELGAPLRSIDAAAAYHCRNRNNEQAGKLSEHARANALDIGALRLANRTSLSLTNPAVAEAFRARIRESACRYFTTVLGPGSDAYHNEHIHLDRAERSHGYRLCQWNVRPPQPVVPLPPPKPVALLEAQKAAAVPNENGVGAGPRRRRN